ncbi:O-antigen ligase [uncultured Psychroserpens sp.]|uniref:O-antigen ligase family protein n=1 Tax=uncultured Psychroserpens sp. TaxID=255436 RepID=UPI00260CCCC6|nr:O-antigen ligase family protein [uncultured Psychroserpens sp.]
MEASVNHIYWNKAIYKKWFSSRPIGYKWMLMVILVFPIFASTWEMKKAAGFSPLQVLGLLVFAFAFISNIRKKAKGGKLIFTLYVFLLLLFFNLILVLLFEFSMSQFGNSIRTLLPFLLFFYFRKYINTKRDLEGFMITFLIASIFPFATLYYEILVAPIREVKLAESRGGGLRLGGFYADLFGYMSHIICVLLTYLYFYIKTLNYRKRHFIYSNYGFAIVLLVCLIGVYNLRHQASWAVSLTLLLIFFHYIRKNITKFQMFVFVAMFAILGAYFYFEVFQTLYAKDINVYQGEAQDSAALNGRMWIWQRYFAHWADFKVVSQWFGVGLEQSSLSAIMMSGGMHNDYIRFFFSTGIIGFICYFSFLIFLIINAFKIKIKEIRFLMLCTLVIIMLYGISALPLLASGALMYFTLAVLSLTKKNII